MGAFDGKNKIARAVADRQTDQKLPDSRSLSWKTITTPTALAGTKGVHCGLVHGDEWNEIKGHRTKNIAQNQTIKVVGKHKETLVESCYQNIIGPQIVLNNHVRNETRLGKFTLIYGCAQNEQSSDGESWVKPTDKACVYGVSFECDLSKVEVMGLHGEVVGVHGEVALCHAEYKTFHTEVNSVHNAKDYKGNVLSDTDNRVKTLESTVKEIDSRSVNTEIETLLLYFEKRTFSIMEGVETHVGPESHTGPAVFAAIAGPGIL